MSNLALSPENLPVYQVPGNDYGLYDAFFAGVEHDPHTHIPYGVIYDPTVPAGAQPECIGNIRHSPGSRCLPEISEKYPDKATLSRILDSLLLGQLINNGQVPLAPDVKPLHNKKQVLTAAQGVVFSAKPRPYVGQIVDVMGQAQRYLEKQSRWTSDEWAYANQLSVLGAVLGEMASMPTVTEIVEQVDYHQQARLERFFNENQRAQRQLEDFLRLTGVLVVSGALASEKTHHQTEDSEYHGRTTTDRKEYGEHGGNRVAARESTYSTTDGERHAQEHDRDWQGIGSGIQGEFGFSNSLTMEPVAVRQGKAVAHPGVSHVKPSLLQRIFGGRPDKPSVYSNITKDGGEAYVIGGGEGAVAAVSFVSCEGGGSTQDIQMSTNYGNKSNT